MGEKFAGSGQKIYVMKTILTPGVYLPLPWGCIHVYDHNIQIFTSLKPLGQLKPNFMWSNVGRVKKISIKCQGHMTKMAAMAMNSKNL